MSRYFYPLGISLSFLYQPLSLKSLCIHNYQVAFLSNLCFRTQILKNWFLSKVVFSLDGALKALHCYSSKSQLDVGYRNIPSIDLCTLTDVSYDVLKFNFIVGTFYTCRANERPKNQLLKLLSILQDLNIFIAA